MKNGPVISGFLFVALAIASSLALASPKDASRPPNATAEAVLFYGDGCPHCALVEEYVTRNGLDAKVPFARKEVYNNQENARELAAKAEACGMPTDSIGVPFLWDGTGCLVGDRDIIAFFDKRAAEIELKR